MPPTIEEVRKAIADIAEAWNTIGQKDPRAA
jgi:flagellin-specific chaperone FliS